MTKKTSKPKGIPLATLFLDEHFQRHYEIFMSESSGDPVLKKTVMR